MNAAQVKRTGTELTNLSGPLLGCILLRGRGKHDERSRAVFANVFKGFDFQARSHFDLFSKVLVVLAGFLIGIFVRGTSK